MSTKVSNGDKKSFSKRIELPIFRERLMDALNKRNLSQRALALSISRDPRSINHIFSGEVKAPDLNTLKELADALNVSVDWLLGLKASHENLEDNKDGHIIRYFTSKQDVLDNDKAASISYTPLSRFKSSTSKNIVTCPVHTELYQPFLDFEDMIYCDLSQTHVRSPGFYLTYWKKFDEVFVEHLIYKDKVTHTYPQGSVGYKSQAEPVSLEEDTKIIGKVLGKYTQNIFG